MKISDELSKMRDKELVELHAGIGDPDYREMVYAEERRRSIEKTIQQSKRSNIIAITSLLIAAISLIISIVI